MTVYQEPAFPSTETNEGHLNPGMSLRDYFAAKVMQVFINKAPQGTLFGESYPETNNTYARAAYSMADAMLNVRNK